MGFYRTQDDDVIHLRRQVHLLEEGVLLEKHLWGTYEVSPRIDFPVFLDIVGHITIPVDEIVEVQQLDAGRDVKERGLLDGFCKPGFVEKLKQAGIHIPNSIFSAAKKIAV